MAKSIEVHDFGERDGLRIYRVFGELDQLNEIINECKANDPNFEMPEIVQKLRQPPTMLLKIKVLAKVGETVD